VPLSPSSPKKLAVLAVALAAGLFLGIGSALMRESLANRDPRPANAENGKVASLEPTTRIRPRVWADDDEDG
jgi:hypothetical protein